METLEKIYKRNSRGKVLFWYLEIEGDKYRTVSGQEGGVEKRSAWTTAKPKNVGRSNATTAEEQARLEAEAKYEKKLSREYRRTIEEIDNIKYIKPMLAAPYYREATSVAKEVNNKPTEQDYEDGIYVQAKLDGVRCIITKDGMFSREGKLIISAPHVYEELREAFEAVPDFALDGELYNHELRDNFNEIVSLVRRTKPSEEELEASAEVIKYYVYDLPNSTQPYSERQHILNCLNVDQSGVIRILPSYQVADQVELEGYFEYFLEEGFEGMMVRKGVGLYENKRSKNLLKHKIFIEEEFTVHNILEGEGNNAKLAAKIEIHLDNGMVVYPNMMGSWDYCKTVLLEKEKFIGGQATVSHFGRTPDGSLRFPRAKCLYPNQRDI